MKKILLDSSKNFYKANLHCHSTKSDGIMTVDELKAAYKLEGYSIIAFTDHEHLIDNSYLNDENFLAITSAELAIKEFEDVSTLKNRAMKVCHLNIYSKDAHNIKTPCYNSVLDHYVTDEIKDVIYVPEKDYKRPYSGEEIAKLIRNINKEGFLVTYNHPRWSLENAVQYLNYKDLWAVEIYNSECNVGGLYEYDINVYDDFLRDGQNLACTASDDNHGFESMFKGFTVINAPSLEYDEIIKAMENHSLYASTGPIIKELYIEDDYAYITYEKGSFSTMTTYGRRADRKIAENDDGENQASFKIFPDDKYVRFSVVDKYGKRADTCAYFL